MHLSAERLRARVPDSAPPPLRDCLRVFAPAYRGKMAQITILNLFSAMAIFAELQLLRALTVVLSSSAAAGETSCRFRDWISSGLPLTVQACGLRLPLFLLAAYGVLLVLQTVVDLSALSVNSRLSQQARHDVERELLRNLLRQDDAFYLRRSPSEIISRLGGDLQRVGGRRQIVTQAIGTSLYVIAIAWVLMVQSWLAACIGLAISLIGVLASQPMLHKLRALDREAIASDEQVKAAFEDTLQGVAEIQVSGLLGRVLSRFEQRQNVRDLAALRNADLNNFNSVLQKLTFSVGFIAIIMLYVFTDLFRDSGPPSANGDGTATAGLIVVLVTALPQLYFRFAELTQLLTQFQIADVSASRLSQYEASPPLALPADPTSSDAVQDGAIALRGVRYQFSGSQAVRGGPDGITCNIPPRGMTGIIGPAGAGKSTLLRLLLGRQQPLDGTIDYPSGGKPESCFVYLPQRPVLFDAQLRDNLFLNSPKAEAASLASAHERFERLGLLDLIRQKGLEALPAQGADLGSDLAAIRRGFRQAAKDEFGADLFPLGRGRSTPRQMVIEGQLGCAVDQVVLAERLTSPYGREPIRGLSALPYGQDMAPHGMALLRKTAPLLAQAGSADDYNRVAAVKIDPRIWELRVSALERTMGRDGELGADSNRPLVAVAVSARLEELESDALPLPEADACMHLNKLVAGISRPLQTDRLNVLLTWRENLLFAALDRTNNRRLMQLDALLLRHLRSSPLDNAVIEAGLDFSVGRLGGRLSGGQQQLVALGRALLSPAPFLILDEPSSAFHPQLRANLIAVLQEEARSRSVVVVTHDMDIAQACERLLFVRDGSIVGQGSWAQLIDENEDFKAWIAGRKEAP